MRRARRVSMNAISVDAEVRDWFTGEGSGGWSILLRETKQIRKMWACCCDEIMAAWVAEHPGRRPRAWWIFEARAQRQRIGGVGELADSDLYNMSATGLPAYWVAVDPNNPPKFEAQAVYLERHRLFKPGERARLRPGDFAPEIVSTA